MPMPAYQPADDVIDDGFPWSPFLDHYLTPGEIEDAFDEANGDNEAEFLDSRAASILETAEVPF